MPKFVNALTDLKIRSAKPKDKPYSLRDGEGLYLLVKPNGKKLFRLDYTYMGRRNTYTIGEYPRITLQKARQIKYEIKDLIAAGIDPNRHKQEQAHKARLEANKKLTAFVIDAYLDHKRKEVSEERYKKNYRNTFANYITPVIGELRIDEVGKHDIIKAIKRTMTLKLPNDNRSRGKTYKAREVHRLLVALFDFAMHHDYVQVNPAATLDIDKIVPKHKKEHMKAVTDERIKEIYAAILAIDNPILRLPLQFLALTAVRPGNIANLRWEYVDYDKDLIVYPAEVMKIKKHPFRLPLTPTLKEIIEASKETSRGEWVFCSLTSSHKPIHTNTLLAALKAQGVTDHMLHGFRSSFRTLAAEHQREHGCSAEAIEAQLHHTIGNSVMRSYMRSDFLDERRRLMEWWETYLKDF